MKFLSFALVLWATLLVSAQAQTLAFDGMDVPNDYTDATPIVTVNGGSNIFGAWLDGGGAAATNIQSQATGAVYRNLVTTPGSLTNTATNFSKVRRQIANGDVSGTTVYFSVIYDKGDLNNTLDYMAFGNALGQERFRFVNNGGEIEVQYFHSSVLSTLGTTSTLSATDKIFIVGAYANGTASDGLTLYFNPTDLNDVAGTALETLTFAEGTDFAFAYEFEYIQISFNRQDTIWDEFRFSWGAGASLADVVPNVVIYDGFSTADYTPGNSVIGVNGGTDIFGAWLDGGGAAATNILAQATGSSYLNLITTDGSMAVTTGGFSKVRRQIADGDVSGTTVYFSVIYDKGDLNNTLDYMAFGNALGQERFRFVNNGGEIEVQYFHSSVLSTLGTTSTLSATDKIFIVGAYANGTASDGLTLYFNPTDLNDVAGTALETLTFAEGTDFAFAYEFEYIQLSANIVNTVWDEFRFAWGPEAILGDVVPNTGPIARNFTLAYDGLDVPNDYADGGPLIGINGGSNFFGEWLDGAGSGVESLDATTSGLSYLNLETTPGSLIQTVNGFDKLRRQISDGDIPNGTLYFSYIYQKGDSNNALDYLAFGEALGQQRIEIRNNGAGEIEVYTKATTTVIGTTTGLSGINTLFVVGKYSKGTASNGLQLWFNPTDLSDVENTATASLSFTEAQTGTLSNLEYTQISFNIANTQYDEFRWAYGPDALLSDVVPLGPEPTFFYAYDGFSKADYTDDTILQGQNGGTVNGSAGFGREIVAGTRIKSLHDGGLSYGNLATTDGGTGVFFDATGLDGGFTRNVFYAATTPKPGWPDGTTLYASMLVRFGDPIPGAPVDPNFFGYDADGIDWTNGNNTSLFQVRNNSKTAFDQLNLLVGGSVEDTTTALDLTSIPTTLLLVYEITLNDNPAVDDTITVYINPSDLTDVPGTAEDTLTVSESGVGSNFTAGWTDPLAGIFFKSGMRDNALDEIRFAWGADATMADVLPLAFAPATVTVAANGADMEVTFDTMDDGLTYQLEKSTSLSGWTAVVGQSVVGDGSTGVVLTDTGAAPTSGQKVFYRIRVSL